VCVSVLESDLDSRKQLESAVGSIAERLSRADAGSLEMEAKKLESERLDVLKKLDEIRNQLTEARADEYRDIVLPENPGHPPMPLAKSCMKGGARLDPRPGRCSGAATSFSW